MAVSYLFGCNAQVPGRFGPKWRSWWAFTWSNTERRDSSRLCNASVNTKEHIGRGREGENVLAIRGVEPLSWIRHWLTPPPVLRYNIRDGEVWLIHTSPSLIYNYVPEYPPGWFLSQDMIKTSSCHLQLIDLRHIKPCSQLTRLTFRDQVLTSFNTKPLSHLLPAFLWIWTVLSFGEKASSETSNTHFTLFTFKDYVVPLTFTSEVATKTVNWVKLS